MTYSVLYPGCEGKASYPSSFLMMSQAKVSGLASFDDNNQQYISPKKFCYCKGPDQRKFAKTKSFPAYISIPLLHTHIYEVILYSHQFECVACVHGHPGDNVDGIDHSPMTNTDNEWICLETRKYLATLLPFFLCAY